MNPAAEHDALARAARVKLMIFDVDGVLTDGSLFFGAGGDAMKPFNSLDGHGIKLLHEAGIATAIITGRQSPIVAQRAAELKIAHLFQGAHNKSAAFAQLCAQLDIAPDLCGYMGDDWPDLPVMQQCGFAAAPVNAHAEVIARAHWTSRAQGGHGAVREVCDLLLRAQHRYDAMLAMTCGARRA